LRLSQGSELANLPELEGGASRRKQKGTSQSKEVSAGAGKPIRRSRTAIRRYRCSKPVSIALADGVINKTTSVFDYGCGHGEDAAYLRSRGIRVETWDPHFSPDAPLRSSAVVNLGYVLNVIEDPAERLDTLRRAFSLAKTAFVVSVRIDGALQEAAEFGDGWLTDVGTFQKFFGQEEFRKYLESALERHAYLVAPGVAYVFVDQIAEAQYLATRAFSRRLEYRTDLIEDFAKNKIARRYVNFANRLGRLPTRNEFSGYDKLLTTFGSQQRLQRLALRQVDREAFEGSREQCREDVLTYLSMLRLQGLPPPPLHGLPSDIRNHVLGVWGVYKNALGEAQRFLFSLGNPEAVSTVCRTAGVGKLLPEDLYVHRSAENDLPALLRLLIFAGWLIVGEISYDLVKIALDGRALSFLQYSNFDEDPHPTLARSIRVHLPRAHFAIRDYRSAANPPILHRKETMVRSDYPHFEAFKQLTEKEEALGLLSAEGIGFRDSWQSLLRASGVEIVGHTLSITGTFYEATLESNASSRSI
jgi:DNA phosphorothioation-associated putative methyltransferase